MSRAKDKLIQAILEIDDLPTLPSIMTQLENAFNADDSDADDIAKIIAEDVAMASRILKVSNSAFFGIPGAEFVSIRDAVARIGFAETKKLCTTISLISMTADLKGSMDQKMFWKHSLVVAVTTRVLGEFSAVVKRLNKDELYTAGLMHDIGVFILDGYFPDLYRNVVEISDAEGMARADVERMELGMDRGEVGGILLESWKLPKGIVEAVRWHHMPELSKDTFKSLVQTVHIAEFVSTCLGVGDGGDGTTHGFSDEAWESLNLSVDDIPKIIDAVKKEVEKCTTLVSLC